MVQKTYHITEFTQDKLEAVLSEVASMQAYHDAEQVLLIDMEQNWDKRQIREKLELIRSRLPKAEIVGTTHVDRDIIGHEEKNCVLTFLMFEEPAFTVKVFPMSGKDDMEVRDELREYLQPLKPQAKGMLALFQKMSVSPAKAGRAPFMVSGDNGGHLYAANRTEELQALEASSRDAGLILEGAGDVPVIGADAAISSYPEDGGIGYVFDWEDVYQDTLVTVIFCGENLHLKVSYNFGWTPVGKIMTVTGLEDPFTVTEIDGRPAAEVYEKYLGIPYKTNPLSTLNICEFPLTIERDGLRYARIPYAWTQDGKLKFTTAFEAGEHIRLSYGLPQQIFDGVCSDASGFREFEAQGMLMVICLNRLIFLREGEQFETGAYRSVVPDAAFLHGNSEMFRNHGTGGEMHSALVAMGLREGDLKETSHTVECEMREQMAPQVIPLELRLMSFMRSVTADLEQTTAELTQLKDHLEDEVEIKTRENEGLSLHVVQTLAEAIDAKDTYTNGHSSRVAAYSVQIAKRAGYSEKDQTDIYMMGLLHDVGKIGVPDAVINKPGKLTDEEFAQIKNHPVMGARILKTIKEMPKLVTGARWHHERYNGKGYPDGLAGEDIPEEARIIAVADAYDAMTSNRSYRRGMTQEKVREQIETGKGTQFDPGFADIMLQMIDEDTDYQMREM